MLIGAKHYDCKFDTNGVNVIVIKGNIMMVNMVLIGDCGKTICW